jgi:hypothetical protein
MRATYDGQTEGPLLFLLRVDHGGGAWRAGLLCLGPNATELLSIGEDEVHMLEESQQMQHNKV